MNNFDKRPLLIYDGECQFCIKWANKFKISTGDHVTFIPLQKTSFIVVVASILSFEYLQKSQNSQGNTVIENAAREDDGAEGEGGEASIPWFYFP